MEEIWKDIEGFEGIYQVSNLGRIKSLKFGKEKIRKIHNNGFKNTVTLCKNGKFKNYKVHQLVAQAFIPNPDNRTEIDHIDTNTSNNRVENLRWVTHKENMNNPLTKEKLLKNCPTAKPILQFTKEGKLIRKWKSAKDIERELGYSNADISKCCNGKQKTCGGYKWHFHYKGIWLKNHIPQIKKAA